MLASCNNLSAATESLTLPITFFTFENAPPEFNEESEDDINEDEEIEINEEDLAALFEEEEDLDERMKFKFILVYILIFSFFAQKLLSDEREYQSC